MRWEMGQREPCSGRGQRKRQKVQFYQTCPPIDLQSSASLTLATPAFCSHRTPFVMMRLQERNLEFNTHFLNSWTLRFYGSNKNQLLNQLKLYEFVQEAKKAVKLTKFLYSYSWSRSYPCD